MRLLRLFAFLMPCRPQTLYHTITMPLSPTQYTERRDALAGLLHETAVALRSVSEEAQYIQPGLIQKHITELENIRNKVFEDQFRLVLVARFQGGKSTTFNAVAMGGRVISPMGDGAIKCSASLIAARNCEDPAQRRVTLQWRNLGELERLCEDVLTSGPVDLSSPSGLTNARKEFEAEFAFYQANRDRYSTEKFELLPIVDFITRFLADPRLSEIKQDLENHPPSAADVAKLVRFPDSFSLRWPNQANSFTLEECLFVFLGSTHLAVEAPSLKRLGLEVVDCPGLFASRYDTGVATAMIATADAVWYLLDGKSAGDGDLKAIALCRQLAKDALFVSVNLKADTNSTRKHITTKVIPHIEGQLAQAGLTVELQPYHALLALLSQTGAQLLRSNEDAGTTLFMRQLVDDWSLDDDSKLNSAAEYWSALCEHLLNRLKSGDKDFSAAGGQLNPQTLAVVEREAGLSDILGRLEQFVVAKRAETILIKNGLDKAINAVTNGVERPLASLEKVAQENEITAYEEYEKANKILEEFEKNVQNQFEFIEGNSGQLLDEQLVREFLDQAVIPSISEIAFKISEDYYTALEFKDSAKEYSISDLYKKIYKTDEELFVFSFNKIFNEEIKNILSSWIRNLTSKNSVAYSEIIYSATRVNNNLKDYWRNAIIESRKLQTLSEPTISLASIELVDFKGLSFDSTSWVDYSQIIMAVAFPFNLIFKGIKNIYNRFKNEDDKKIEKQQERDEFINSMKNDLIEVLDAALTSERESIIAQFLDKTNGADTSLSFIRISIIKNLREPIDLTRTRFDEQRENAEAIFQKKSGERAKIAEDCRRLREESVVPLRMRLEAYRNETAWALK